MASIYGIDPFYTYTYDDSSLNRADSCIKEHQPDKTSLMYYLQKKHPKFTQIVTMANYIGKFSDLQFRGTLFLPKEESIDENILGNFDINTSRKFIEYHLMSGFFPQSILMTSPYQQLQNYIRGQYITAGIYILQKTGKETLVLNNSSYVEEFDIRTKNAFIHIIDKPLEVISYL
jgi:uncharacterized surface protein with fasciclin (FAS1) repeats